MSDLWELPFSGNDFKDNQRVLWGAAEHSTKGVQTFGYDLTGHEFDASVTSWIEFENGGRVNSDFVLYGKPVYAMEDGTVIAGWRNAPENPGPWNGTAGSKVYHEEITQHVGTMSRIYGGGNGIWVQHADGTLAEYAHLQPGTLPSALCPHDDELLPNLADSPDVRHCWDQIVIPVAKRATIRKGQFLGNVGNAGTSSHPHLHIHREKGATFSLTAKSGGEPVKLKFARGLAGPKTDEGVYVDWTTFAGSPIPSGPILIWPPRSRAGEHARHMSTFKDFGLFFGHFADSGLWPEWLDFYSVGGEIYINQIWREAKRAWTATVGVDAATYKKVLADNKKAERYPVISESFTKGGEVFYTAVFVHKQPGKYHVDHGLTYDQHMKAKDEKATGLSPVSISVVSVGGKRQYTILYREGANKNWNIKSQVHEKDYQDLVDKEKLNGRFPVYLSAYVHGGEPYLSVVFANVSTEAGRWRHKLSSSAYSSEYAGATGDSMKTRAVTAFDGARSQHRYAAAWWT